MKPFPIRYAWNVKGIVNYGNTVASGADANDARRRFQKENRHVVVVARNEVIGAANVAAIIESQNITRS